MDRSEGSAPQLARKGEFHTRVACISQHRERCYFTHRRRISLFSKGVLTMKKKLTVGILAHVDAGKTTLSEALLYLSGKLRTRGRVDHGNT